MSLTTKELIPVVWRVYIFQRAVAAGNQMKCYNEMVQLNCRSLVTLNVSAPAPFLLIKLSDGNAPVVQVTDT